MLVDQWQKNKETILEVFVILNLAFLTVDIYLAHSVNEFGYWGEWIPFCFSLISPLVLVTILLLRIRKYNTSLFKYAGLTIGGLSILVGILGTYFHLESQFFQERTIKSLVYTAPFAAPLAYSGLGFLLLMNRMVESLTAEWSKWIITMALGGFLGNFVLSLCDHAQNGFFRITEWIPVFGSAIADTVNFWVLRK